MKGDLASIRIALAALVSAGALLVGATRVGAALPDGRGYELVSHVADAGGESVLSGAQPSFLASNVSGEAVDWEALGVCCGATTGGINTFEAHRTPSGWQSESITPTPTSQIGGFEELQEIKSWSSDLQQTLFSTPASYASGNERPSGSGADDLYLRGSGGALTWVSQGPSGTGKGSAGASFDGATPELSRVAFDTAESLTPNATGLAAISGARYLYVRDPGSETTSLVDVDQGGNLISPYGAALGDLVPPSSLFSSFGVTLGTSTHAISEDGSKVFFETRPESLNELPLGVEPHLYVRDLADATTTPIDAPEATGSARYEGASTDGSLVFFTSNEGLGGATTANELYEFNTTDHPVGHAPPAVAVPLGGGSGVFGVVAIANDGSRVFFVADDVLATNVNAAGRSAASGEPNLYVYDTGSGTTTFVAPLAPPDVSNCKPTCASGEPTHLVGTRDVFRPAYSSADGSVLAFISSNDLTGEDHAPRTALTFEAFPEQQVLTVESTAGFQAGRTIAVGVGSQAELETIEKINSPTEMTLSEYGPALQFGLVNNHPAGATVEQVDPQVYRLTTASGALTCVSCTPPGVLSTQGATLGEVGGGSYAPAGFAPGMSADGSRIFFQSPDPLVAGAAPAVSARATEPTNIYEWTAGGVYLIADASDGGSTFLGTTPSGNDAFFSSESSLVPEATAGYGHLYDARIGGGFPAPTPTVSSPCAQESCRAPGVAGVFVPTPASATLSAPATVAPAAPRARFTVAKVTPSQRAEFAHAGKLTLSVTATAPSGLLASVTAKLHRRVVTVASAHATLGRPGRLTLTLRLDRAARSELASRGSLKLRIEVSFQLTGEKVATQVQLRMSGHGTATEKGTRHA